MCVSMNDSFDGLGGECGCAVGLWRGESRSEQVCGW